MAATLSDTSISAGETVQIAIRVENVGERAGTFEANLTVDGETVSSESVTVDGGTNKTVVFERRFDEPGEYAIAVGEASLGTLEVKVVNTTETVTRPDRDGGEGPIDVIEATVPVDWVRKGYRTTVRATVLNTANRTANQTLTVRIDDRPVANETVTLGPNERDVVRIEFEAISGTVAVEGVEAGRIEVGESRAEVGTGTDEAVEQAGFQFTLGRDGGVLAVVAVVVVLLAGVVLLGVLRYRY